MPASLRGLGKVYLRIGTLTFGGGDATIGALQRELMTERGWLNAGQFGLCYVLARVTPGTNLLAFCTATGWVMLRWRGALIALLAASIPSSIIVAVMTRGFVTWYGQPLVRVAIGGAMAASVGILLASFWLLVRPYLTRPQALRSIAIVLASIILSLLIGLSPVLVLAVAGVAGFMWPEKTGS